MSATPLWTPSPTRRERAHVTAFQDWLARERGLTFADYEALWSWSVCDLAGFWQAVLDYFALPLRTPPQAILTDEPMPGTRWLPGATLNLVDQVFRHRHLDTPAIVYENEAGASGSLSWAELERQVAGLAQTLRELGVEPGDRVAGILPNLPQTVVAFLATASVGGVWSLCAPDMGPELIADRYAQIAPKVLFTVDGYQFSGQPQPRAAMIDGVLARLPSIESVVWVPNLDPAAAPAGLVLSRRVVTWAEAIAPDAPLAPAALDASHPLWILYSSGTTGLPKAIVHGHGGILLNGVVNMVLHNDQHPGERVLWAVNTSWMVWNAHVLHLLGGATLVLYDGAVTGPNRDWSHLWRLAGRQQVNMFGAGAAVHQSCLKAGVVPREVADLSALHTICSTGSPLSAEAYRWLYSAIKEDLWLNVVSGGTDIAGGFLVGLPTLPVREGEMQCRTLGASVQSWNEEGQPVIDDVGELVCTRPLPSMPLGFWGDTDGVRYRESYFEHFPDNGNGVVWRQGDWLALRPRPDAVAGVIFGRSDATINRQGVRMGTADFYRVVEALDAVQDSLVVDLEYLGRPSRLLLFVHLRDGHTLDEALLETLRQSLRQALSPRHVPDEIHAMPVIPRTITGKKLEVPVKRLLLGQPEAKVVRRDGLAQPESIEVYLGFVREFLAR